MSAFERHLGQNYEEQVMEFEELLHLKLEAIMEGATVYDIHRIYYKGFLLSVLMPWAWNDKLACVSMPGFEHNPYGVFVASTGRLAGFAWSPDGLIQRYHYITTRHLSPDELRKAIEAMRAM